jgi:hypothetical protein
MLPRTFQSQRFELKYIIEEDRTPGIRDFLLPYLQLDPFGATQADRTYPVHSLYFDSPDLRLCQSTINGDRNRYKMRVRFYERSVQDPVFFEIKRRENNAIYKERCPVLRDAAGEIIAGRLPGKSDLAGNSPAEERALYRFHRLVNELFASPVAHVSYRREAWHGSGGNRVRVTFDREVVTRPQGHFDLDPRPADGMSVFGRSVVLELKFIGLFPPWMGEMVRIFELQQCSAAKYVDGLLGMQEHRMFPPRPGHPPLLGQAGDRLFKQLRRARGAFDHRLLIFVT